MFDYQNFELLLNDEAPVLDPYIRDMIHQPLSQHALNVAYNNIKYRLRNTGFHKGYDIKLISKHSLDFAVPNIEECVDGFCPVGTAYLLTFSAGNMRFITPPYGENQHEPMSWDEYIFRTFQGEKLSLLIRAPWAQAKFINVGQG